MNIDIVNGIKEAGIQDGIILGKDVKIKTVLMLNIFRENLIIYIRMGME